MDADSFDTIVRAIAAIRPDIVINCIGLIKQEERVNDPLSAITINSQLPHRISLLCRIAGARMIHFSTDCVFDGRKGNYLENDSSNAKDLYGRTKFLGEVGYSHCVTLLTSVIGHELRGFKSLIEWFLSQQNPVQGYTHAIYSGFPTIELSRIIHQYVIPNPDLKGVYHVSSSPISKFDLLKLVAESYGKQIEIKPFSDFRSDRSLDSAAFRKATGYTAPSWPELIKSMHHHFLAASHYRNRKPA